ncbi:PREDICTED: uncharacterized protein LOC109231435 [Nicotiana attenuata]|uniref:uncharacterized protein LOC109231435 n=1 Tax=Nicotiana attenuata TaxID=49451 RepID=UPI000905431F|nr:PREDICTED: uncharacterized protein LOC109231435 [Nicotiana attenuata]
MLWKQQTTILILVPSKSVPSTPIELWTGRKPSLRHIRVWGCPAHVLKGKEDKLESRTEVCIFIGYPKGTNCGLFYLSQRKEDSSLERIPEASIDISLQYRSGRNVNRQQIAQEQPQIVEQPQVVEQPEIVMQPEESEGPSDRGPGVTAIGLRQDNASDSAGPSDRGPGVTAVGPRQNNTSDYQSHFGRDPALQEEVNDILAPLGVENNIEASVQGSGDVIQQQNQPPPVVTSRSGRIIRKPLRFVLLGESYDRIPEEPNTEPINYDEALHDTDADKWVDAMKSEMESMYSNQV